MVTKFLTREQTYATLLSAVSENEKNLDKLRKENDMKHEILRSLQIDHDNDNVNKTCQDSQEITELHS